MMEISQRKCSQCSLLTDCSRLSEKKSKCEYNQWILNNIFTTSKFYVCSKKLIYKFSVLFCFIVLLFPKTFCHGYYILKWLSCSKFSHSTFFKSRNIQQLPFLWSNKHALFYLGITCMSNLFFKH